MMLLESGMQRLSEEAITSAARRGPVFRVMRFRSLRPRGCRSKHGLLFLAQWKEKVHSLSSIFVCFFFLPQIPQEGAIFSRAPFWLILRLVRPSNLHFPFFRVSFSCFSPLWRCDAFRLSSLDAQLQRTIIAATQSCLCFTTVSHKAVCWRHLHRSPLRFPSRIVPRLLPLLHSVRFSRSSRPLVISHSNAPPFPEASRAAVAQAVAAALGLVISPPPVK